VVKRARVGFANFSASLATLPPTCPKLSAQLTLEVLMVSVIPPC